MRALWLTVALLGVGCIAPDEERANPTLFVDERGDMVSPAYVPTPDALPLQCGLPDCAWQWLNVSIRSSGPFEVTLPLPVAEGGAVASAWYSNFTVEGAGTVSEVSTSRGGGVNAKGSGDVLLRSHFWSGPTPRGNGCCAEAYLDTHWTQSNETAVFAWSDGNVTGVMLTHEAHSRHCVRDERYELATGRGWLALQPLSGGGGCE